MDGTRHFSMIRSFHLADFLTLGNAACGVAAVFCVMAYGRDPAIGWFYAAVLLAPAAFAFDVLDGRVARSRQQHSALGRELDSLADVISFGVAPAALAFAAGITLSGPLCAVGLVIQHMVPSARFTFTSGRLPSHLLPI